MTDWVWPFLIGIVVGALIGVFLTALCCAAPDPEEDEIRTMKERDRDDQG